MNDLFLFLLFSMAICSVLEGQRIFFVSNNDFIEERGWKWSKVKNGTYLRHGTKIRQSCRGRYELYKDGYLNEHYMESTSTDGHLEPPLASCKEERCLVPRISGSIQKLSDGSIARGKIEHGVEVTTICDDNFELDPKHINDATSKCGLKRLGQLKLKTCIPKRCDVPEETDNTVYKSRGLTLHLGKIHHGKNIDIICKEGYELFNKSDRITVTCEFGNWTNLPSGCFAKKCSVNQLGDMRVMNVSDTDGTILPDDAEVDSGDKVHPECIKGYMSLDNNTVAPVCNLGEWNGSFACLEPLIQINHVELG